MGDIELLNLSKQYSRLTVFERLSLSLKADRITVLLGPSGCGKTTLLNIIAGTCAADSGTVAGTEFKTVSYIFQEPRLLPWRTVGENIDVILPRSMDRHERTGRVREFTELVGLSGFDGYYPDQLSGGMKQRAAIARAFAYPGNILLMDEPFKGLDLSLRLSLIGAFEELWLRERRTTVFVTHDVQEALLLGDDIIVLSALPASVEARFTADVPRPGRSLEDERMLDLERKLYHQLLHPPTRPTAA